MVEWIRSLILASGCEVKSMSVSGTVRVEIIECRGRGVYEMLTLPGERIEVSELGYGDEPEAVTGVPVN